MTRNGRSILLTALLALILVYLFSIVGFLFLKDDFILEVDRLPGNHSRGLGAPLLGRGVRDEARAWELLPTTPTAISPLGLGWVVQLTPVCLPLPGTDQGWESPGWLWLGDHGSH